MTANPSMRSMVLRLGLWARNTAAAPRAVTNQVKTGCNKRLHYRRQRRKGFQSQSSSIKKNSWQQAKNPPNLTRGHLPPIVVANSNSHRLK